MATIEQRSRKILIIDDEDIVAEALAQRLNRRGFTTTVITDGKDVLEAIERDGIELVLLDIVMPQVDGITVLKSIRSKYGKHEIPVIMVTALDDSVDVVESFKFGANDYINKPVNIDVATARIGAHLSTIDFHKESVRKKELEAINALVITYNHEINSPLLVAAAAIYALEKNFNEDREIYIQKIKTSVDKISEIVRRIKKIGESDKVVYEDYVNSSQKMVSLKKK